MGLMNIVSMLFGGGRNVVTSVAGAIMPNAEAADKRAASAQEAALQQMAGEFGHGGWFNGLVDGLNRLPRPIMAFGTIGMIASAMIDPIWFSERMTGLALVPPELWKLFFAVAAFYFGARELSKFRATSSRKKAAELAASVPQVMKSIEGIRALRHDSPGAADTGSDAKVTLDTVESAASDNPAVNDWRRESGR